LHTLIDAINTTTTIHNPKKILCENLELQSRKGNRRSKYGMLSTSLEKRRKGKKKEKTERVYVEIINAVFRNVADALRDVIEKSKKPVPKPEHLRKQFENGYIAPELVDGSSKPCVETDVYSLAYLVKSVCKLVPLNVNSTVKSALSKRPENRPSLIILKESFQKLTNFYW